MGWYSTLGSDERAKVFDLVRVSAWADGRLSADELSAARGTAMALDMLGDGRVRGALSRPATRASLDVAPLTEAGRHVAFTVAAWIAWIDGEPCDRERALLAELATKLALGDERAESIVREVARLSRELSRERAYAMRAEDWAMEIDGLLAWAVASARRE